VKGRDTSELVGPDAPDYRPLNARARYTLASLAVLGLVLGLSILSTILEIDLLNRMENETVSQREIASNLDRMRVLESASVISLFAAIAAFCFWIYRASRNLRSLGVEKQRFSPAWAVGWWFVPIMFWFRPYQVAAEIWKSSAPVNVGVSVSPYSGGGGPSGLWRSHSL
jgi:hypothetical protein